MRSSLSSLPSYYIGEWTTILTPHWLWNAYLISLELVFKSLSSWSVIKLRTEMMFSFLIYLKSSMVLGQDPKYMLVLPILVTWKLSLKLTFLFLSTPLMMYLLWLLFLLYSSGFFNLIVLLGSRSHVFYWVWGFIKLYLYSITLLLKSSLLGSFIS